MFRSRFPSVGFFLGSVGIGAALMYFYDPQNGQQRRVLLQDRYQQARRELQQGPRALLRDAGERARSSDLGLPGLFGAIFGILGLLRGGLKGLALGAIGSGLIARANSSTSTGSEPAPRLH